MKEALNQSATNADRAMQWAYKATQSSGVADTKPEVSTAAREVAIAEVRHYENGGDPTAGIHVQRAMDAAVAEERDRSEPWKSLVLGICADFAPPGIIDASSLPRAIQELKQSFARLTKELADAKTEAVRDLQAAARTCERLEKELAEQRDFQEAAATRAQVYAEKLDVTVQQLAAAQSAILESRNETRVTASALAEKEKELELQSRMLSDTRGNLSIAEEKIETLDRDCARLVSAERAAREKVEAELFTIDQALFDMSLHYAPNRALAIETRAKVQREVTAERDALRAQLQQAEEISAAREHACRTALESAKQAEQERDEALKEHDESKSEPIARMKTDYRTSRAGKRRFNHPSIYILTVCIQSALRRMGIHWHNCFTDECTPDFTCCKTQKEMKTDPKKKPTPEQVAERRLFAAMAMQGLLAGDDGEPWLDDCGKRLEQSEIRRRICSTSAGYAAAMIAALNEEKP